MANNLYRALEGGRAEREQHRENSGRLASSYVDYLTEGVGTLIDGALLAFDTTYTAEPVVTTGVVVLSPLPDPEATQQPVYPVVTAGVYAWERDNRGYYIGAYMYFVVGYIGTAGDASVRLRHHIVFTAPAYKIMEPVTAGMPGMELGSRLPPAFNPDNY